jgi:pyruvate/2-oxoglutarate dehydrogenase complex dihydrolipoamide acyltransferase (E2) component
MTQDNITVVKWLKSDGAEVKQGELVVVIETEKVSFEVEAPASGYVFSMRSVNDKVKIGEIIGVVADSLEEFENYKRDLPKMKETELQLLVGEAEEEEGVRISFEEEEGEKEEVKVKEERGLPVLPTNVADRKVLKRIPFSGMRRRIADNLLASLQKSAQLTLISETDMTEFARFREELILDYPDIKITFVEMIVKILPTVLEEFPIMNSSIVGDEVICWGEYNIGVAVALEDGLVVPVVRNADTKSLYAISREVKRLAQKARSNELGPEHYRGGTFTLSSGGKVETDIITPIINPPEGAILAYGKIGLRPAVYEGKLAIRTMTYLCLTHDHRVIDGVPASLFLGRLKEIIEHPELFRKILK